MLLIEHLLQTEEVRKAVVEIAFHITCVHVCPAVTHGAHESPPLLAQSTGIGVHGTRGIVAVCARKCDLIVVAAAQTGHAEIVCLER